MAEPYERIADQAFARILDPTQVSGIDGVTPENNERSPARTFGETVERGFEAGVSGLQSSGAMFGALTDTIFGDDDDVQNAIARASEYEREAAGALQGMQEFGDFVNEPTWDGLVTQAGLALGQSLPSLGLTVASALATGGASALIGLVGRGAISATGKIAAKRAIQEATENSLKGVATPDEKELVSQAYQAFRGLTFKRGAYAGALASSYVPLAGENFTEGLEAGRDPDAALALRSLLVAAPQAALDVVVETGLVASLAKVATTKAAGNATSVMGTFARELSKGLGKGVVTEGLSEGAQEGIGVANRISMDPNFTAEEGLLRIAQGTFQGAVGGGALGTAGGLASGTSKSIMAKAGDLIQQGKEQQVNQQADREEFGDLFTGNTTRESQSTINAQIAAMFDPSSGKTAVWDAGPISDRFRSALPEDGVATQIRFSRGDNPMRAFAAHIPGRGVIIGRREDVQAVIDENASDEVLAGVLGYSSNKPEDGDIVVQVLNEDGDVVSEELTNSAGIAAATSAASRLQPEGGSIELVSVKDALRQRKQRVDKEPVVRGMQVNDDGEQVFDDSDPTETDWEGMLDAVRAEEQVIDTFGTKRDPNETFANTKEARDQYDETFGAQDWSSPFYGGMTESLLFAAVDQQNRSPSSRVEIKEDSGTYTLSRVGDPLTAEQDAEAGLIAAAVGQARRGKFARVSEAEISGGPNNLSVAKVNLTTLTNAGRALGAKRGTIQGADPVTAARLGLLEILADLADQGYDLTINGSPISDVLNDPRLGDSRILGSQTAAIVDGTEMSLSNLLRGNVVGREAARQSAGAEVARRKATREAQQQERANAEFDLATGQRSPSTPDVTAGDFGYAINEDGRTSPVGEPSETLSDTQAPQEVRSEPDARGETDTVPQTQLNTEISKVAFNINRDRGPATPATGTGGFARPAVTETQDPQSVRWTDSVDSRTSGAPQRRTPEGEVADSLTKLLKAEIANWMGEAPAATKPVTGNAKQSKTFGGTYYPSGAIGDLATQVLNRASKALRLRMPTAVMGIRELQNMSEADFTAMFGDAFVAQTVRQQMQALLDNDSSLGRYIGFKDTHVILVDNRTSNQLQTSLAVAHELGHALYQEEKDTTLNTPAVRDRLQKAFRRSLEGDDVPESYKGEFGFEEWFSDQVGSWAQSIYLNEKRPARNMVDRTFKQIAERLTKMFKALSSEMRRRFGKEAKSVEALDFIELVSQRNRERYSEVTMQRGESPLRSASYNQKLLVRRMEDSVTKDPKAQKAVLSIAEQIRKVMYSERVAPLTKLLLPEDNILRNISPTIADFFYVRSQSGSSSLGFLDAKTNARNRILNDLEDAIGDDWDSAEVREGFEKAATDTPTAELDGKARQIRDFLDGLYDNYIGKVPGVKIGRRENYFPVGLDLAKIYADPEAFVQTVLKHTEASPSYIRRVVDKMVQQQQNIIDDTVEIDFVATNPLTTVEEARQLTQNVPQQELAQFSLPPDEALLKYIRHIVIRVEFKRATTDQNGTDVLGPALDQLSAKDQEEAKRVIERYLGYTKTPINPKLQAVNGWLQMFNWVTLLPLAMLSSIPELGGAVLNSKEFSGVTEAMKQTLATIKNREEAQALARDLGVTVSSTMANLGLTDADDEFLDPRVRKWSDKFFDGIGLTQFTRFTREFASNMAVQFVLRHADGDNGNPRSPRYLAELDVTAEQVNRWYKSQSSERGFSFEGEDGQAVKEALTRFVESSMLRPNAAERPAWANDPRFALIWQLKSFLYSFSKVIIGGLKREMGARFAEGDTTMDKLGGVGYQLALAGVAFMPLAMFSLELRELSKFLLAKTLPGVDANARFFRTDRMDWPEYMSEIFDRAGYAGPLAIFGMMSQSAEWGDTGLSPILGPTYGFLVDDVALGLLEGKGLDIIPERVIPLYNVVI